MLRAIISRVPVASVVEVDDDAISLNLEAMRALLPGPPQVPQLPWRAVAGACESALGAVHRTVCDEFERNVQFFAELEFEYEDEGRRPPSPLTPEGYAKYPSFFMSGSFPLKYSSIPVIVVTPCPDDPVPVASRRCFVPLQDAAFGDRLCVPAQPTVNEVFPPLVRVTRGSSACIRLWEYSGGHWRAVPPSLEEQTRRVLVTRSLTQRRRRAASGR